jgi:phenylalanyl-tRNA synthetase beta chain
MRVTIDWLREYVDIEESAEEVAEVLTASGTAVEEILEHEGEAVLDLEITTNRPDCLGVIGVARELAAVTGRPLRWPSLEATFTGEEVGASFSVEIEDLALCPRYTARLVRGVRVGPSPAWLRRRLEAVGIRSVSNVVDISNYVLMEWSQPLHFFDAAKLRGGRIVVRPAIPGEAITAIDGKEYELNADRLVIADGGGVVAIAGVMGGIESEVSDATRDILIESAAFSAPSVRRTSRELALASESSYRFERFVDPALSERASLRAAVLLAELADGEIAPGVVDVGAPLGDRPPAALRWSQIRRLLGVDVPREKVRSYFEGLDLEIRREDDTSIEVRPPSWRVDLEREADLLEEVARIHGFDVVPAETSMPVRSPRRSPMDRTIEAARSFLVGAGLHEIVTLNLVREGVAANPPVWTDREPLEVRNPVRAGEGFLRRSLLGSLLAAADLNRDRGREGIRLFEIAAIDLPREGGGEPEERTVVSISSRTTTPGSSVSVGPCSRSWGTGRDRHPALHGRWVLPPGVRLPRRSRGADGRPLRRGGAEPLAARGEPFRGRGDRPRGVSSPRGRRGGPPRAAVALPGGAAGPLGRRRRGGDLGASVGRRGLAPGAGCPGDPLLRRLPRRPGGDGEEEPRVHDRLPIGGADPHGQGGRRSDDRRRRGARGGGGRHPAGVIPGAAAEPGLACPLRMD